jgi:hypothetical protein
MYKDRVVYVLISCQIAEGLLSGDREILEFAKVVQSDLDSLLSLRRLNFPTLSSDKISRCV